MIKFLKTLHRIVKSYDADHDLMVKAIQNQGSDLHAVRSQLYGLNGRVTVLSNAIEEARKYIKDRTELSADVSPNTHKYRGTNTVIVVGRYKNNDFVEVYSLNVDHFRDIVSELRRRSKYSEVHIIDAAPEFRAFIKQEIEDGK